MIFINKYSSHLNEMANLRVDETGIKNVVIYIMKQIIFFIHLILYLAAILTPFIAPREIQEMFSLIVPFLFLHWSLNETEHVNK